MTLAAKARANRALALAMIEQRSSNLFRESFATPRPAPWAVRRR